MPETKPVHTFWNDSSVPSVAVRCTRRSAESYKAHCHREFCVGAVTEGKAVMTVRNETCVLSPGLLAVIPPETVHSCNPPEGGTRSYRMAFFDTTWCCSLQEELFGRQGDFIPPAQFLLESDALYVSFLELTELLAGDALPLEKTERATQFASELFVSTCDRQLPAPGKERAGIIPEVKEYLEQHADLNITLQELAVIFRCNPYHLLRTFKQAVGLPPHAFMLNARIEEAKRLLLEGMPPASVAAETGFADQSHFHKTFRRLVAATPRQYQLRPGAVGYLAKTANVAPTPTP
ncbi:AraC family transcriptional regulator [Geomonas paludis]|uniref:AraC family transcriptional regulator n=1 Tax=Geomonas paludis TaxID=2740185 RepID=A0ABY4L9W0_9BACT|nr:AraC family transcriptional regulator [Geomonas paludis]UPU34773.1 AraC family transcriptional regulator [Geomonas paludis]